MPAPIITWGGLNLSSTDEFGCIWTTENFGGWDGSPGSSLAPVSKPRGPGAWAGNAYTNARHLVGAGHVTAPTEDALRGAFNRLNDAVSNDDALLEVVEGSTSRWCMARRSDEVIPSRAGMLEADWSIQGIALDPRKHGDPLTASTALPSTSGGFSFPMSFPFSINSQTVSGQVSLTNPGNTTGSMVLRIDGPCVGPVITHVASGLRLVFAASLVLGAGEWIDVDLEARTVMANGQSSRANWITSRQWFGFESGNNTLAFTATSYTPGALLTVTATPAWS